MKSDLLSDIRERLRRYLANEISLDAFRHWFDVETWDIIDKSPPATQQFAGEIELRLAEYTNGHRTEDDLRSMLQPLLSRESVADR
jgi:hypothetical protein